MRIETEAERLNPEISEAGRRAAVEPGESDPAMMLRIVLVVSMLLGAMILASGILLGLEYLGGGFGS